MLKSLQCAFARKSVKAPKQKNVELALTCGFEHLLKRWPVRSSARDALVNELVNDIPALRSREGPKLKQLVLAFLFVRRNPAIQSASHCLPSFVCSLKTLPLAL